jgi:5-hydroxyisourate hydrolase-like protein (transthyretin family)
MKSTPLVLFALLSTACTTPGIKAGAEKVPPSGPILLGRVTDHVGRPVPGVKIVLYDGLGERHPVAEAVTNAKGDYRFDPCNFGWWVEREDEPGFYDRMVGLQLVHPDLVSADGCWWWDRIVKGGTGKRTRHDIVVASAGSLSGTVVEDGTRTPAPGLSLELVGVGENRYLRPVATDAEGRFVAQGMYPGTYEVEIVTPEGYRRPIGRAQVNARQTSEVWLALSQRPEATAAPAVAGDLGETH